MNSYRPIRSQTLYPTELRAQTALDLPQLTTLIILSHLSLIVKRFEKDLEFTQLAIQFSFVFCRVSQEIQHKQFPNWTPVRFFKTINLTPRSKSQRLTIEFDLFFQHTTIFFHCQRLKDNFQNWQENPKSAKINFKASNHGLSWVLLL